MTVPVVLSYGMGIDSTAILLRWLTEPASRDFDLSDLIVVSAMTGDEFTETDHLVTDHILPRLRADEVRYAQIARAGPYEADGITVFDDSRRPLNMHMRGSWSLSDELRGAGTIPQVASGRRLCSVKFKGWPIDRWLDGELGATPFRHVMGFNADEQGRADRDSSYSTVTRLSEYPLITWGWDRERCDTFITAVTGANWVKSCCTFCPFARDNHLDRYRRNPAAAVDAMLMEFGALALNPRSTLFSKKSVIALVEGDGNVIALDAFHAELASIDWSLFEVRRIIFAKKGDPTAKGPAARSVRALHTGGAPSVHNALRARAADAGVQPVIDRHGILRATIRHRGSLYPTLEHILVAAPALIGDKQRASFEKSWATYSALPEPENPTPALFDLDEAI